MKCPGQDSQYWKADAIYEVTCPTCGNPVEFFKDEPTRTCKNCGHKIVNPKLDFGCASYCQFADQCLGELPPELLAEKENLLKDRVAIEMRRYFKGDFKRANHATRVAKYAEKLTDKEKGSPAVTISAAYLHDIGIKEAERKYKSTDAKYQEEEGTPITRDILNKLKAKDDLVEEVCDIVGRHHHPRAKETINFKIVFDADQIVNMEEKYEESTIDNKRLSEIIDKTLLTEGGRELAKDVLLNKETT